MDEGIIISIIDAIIVFSTSILIIGVKFVKMDNRIDNQEEKLIDPKDFVELSGKFFTLNKIYVLDSLKESNKKLGNPRYKFLSKELLDEIKNII
ncbi:MAG: hypothetical protein ACUVWP_03390 [bacterium]